MIQKWGSLTAGFLSGGYTLIEIQEEPVPLALVPEAEGQYFGLAVELILLKVLLFAVVLYMIACQRFRARIRRLDKEGNAYRGWNLKRLRECVEELELKEADRIVDDMEKVFSKKIMEAEPFLE